MGTDCNIYLPSNVRLHDVAMVIGIALGCEVTRDPYLHVPNVKIVPQIPEMSTVEVARTGSTNRAPSFHYEPGRKHIGRRLVKFSADPESVAVARVLVDFFGGHADFNDCDATDRDYEQPDRSDAENCPEDGEEWDAFQARMWALSGAEKARS